MERPLRQIARQKAIGHGVGVDEPDVARVVGHEARSVRVLQQMLAESLERVGDPKRGARLHGEAVGTHQAVELLLVDLLPRPLGEQSTRSVAVPVVDELGRVGGKVLLPHPADGLCRLAVEAHIIKIGRGHDAVFAPRIDHPPLLARSELQGGLVDAAQPLGRLLVGVVEVLVARLSLADTHLQDVAHEQFDLVVGDGVDGVAELFGAREVHPHDGHEGQVVERLADHAVVATGHLECAARIGRGAVEAAVVVVVGQVVVVVGLLRSLLPTPHEPCHRRQDGEEREEDAAQDPPSCQEEIFGLNFDHSWGQRYHIIFEYTILLWYKNHLSKSVFPFPVDVSRLIYDWKI